jgi:carbamoyltransferase
MSVILGINTFHAGASAALVIDGVPVAALAEERLNRVKYYAGFPKHAVAACLEMAGVGLSDIDAVAVGRDSSANLRKKLRFALGHPTKLLNLARMRRKSTAFDDMKTVVASECYVDSATLTFQTYNVEHHLAHTASAYFVSGWDACAGITIDGSGDFVTCMLSECVGDEIRPLKKIFVPHSLGTLYTAVCQFIGYPHYGDEGKVMGLAPLGTDRYAEFFDRMLTTTGDGFELAPEYFRPFGANQGIEMNAVGQMVVQRLYSDLFVRELGAPRDERGEITQRDRDVAFGLQQLFERHYTNLFASLHARVPSTRVAMAGGCALNSVANGKLLLETTFRETCIQPAAGDDGLAIGAALYVSNSILKEGRRWVMTDAYLGNEFSDSVVRRELDRHNVSYRQLDREPLLHATAAHLDNGNVVGWFQGRMEWGPRALGNRSILAHPGFPGMKDILNARIKHREAFRPFAPSVLRERQSELFEQDHPSPFMMHVYKIRPEWRERLSAVTHVDGTGRLQTVTRDENTLYYDLIKAFEAKSGIPVILNTSFNENEPIVCRPSEAIECFLRTRMDVLVIGSFVCEKPDAGRRDSPAL